MGQVWEKKDKENNKRVTSWENIDKKDKRLIITNIKSQGFDNTIYLLTFWSDILSKCRRCCSSILLTRGGLVLWISWSELSWLSLLAT